MAKTAFLFSGQGAQFSGMGSDLYKSSDEAKKIYDFADSLTDGRISKVSFDGSEDDLKLTINTQPCILTYEAVLLALAEKAQFKVDMTAGFSLGEYGAMICAKVLSFQDALTLIIKRANFMNEVANEKSGKMAAVIGAENQELIQICSEIPGYVEPVNFNCPGQTVIAGDSDSVEQAIEVLTSKGCRCVLLSVNGAFHSKHMIGAADKFRVAVADQSFGKPQIPLVSNVSAKPEDDFKTLAPEQMCSPVLWEKSIRYMIDAGVKTFVEVGPGNVMCGFMKKIDRTLECNHIINLLDKR